MKTFLSETEKENNAMEKQYNDLIGECDKRISLMTKEREKALKKIDSIEINKCGLSVENVQSFLKKFKDLIVEYDNAIQRNNKHKLEMLSILVDFQKTNKERYLYKIKYDLNNVCLKAVEILYNGTSIIPQSDIIKYLKENGIRQKDMTPFLMYKYVSKMKYTVLQYHRDAIKNKSETVEVMS